MKIEQRKRGGRRFEDRWFCRSLSILCGLLIVGSMISTAYLLGVNVEREKNDKQKVAQETAMTKERIQHYGREYLYFRDNGVLYFVKDKKDLENKDKWIKTKEVGK
jgi:hypothetical protein